MAPSAGRASLVLLLGRRIQAQICYLSDQTVVSDQTVLPQHIVCNASAQASLCCQQGATCLTSGLCFLEWDHSLNTGSCTDRTWTNPSCFHQCPPSPGNGFYVLYRCNDNLWCCSAGDYTTSCCNDDNVHLFPLEGTGVVMGGTGFQSGFTIAPLELLQTSKSTAASSAVFKPQSTAAIGNITKAQTPRPEFTASASGALKTGMSAGLGVGLPLLAALIVALIFLTRLRSRSNSRGTNTDKKTDGVEMDGNRTASHGLLEMYSLPSEMPGSRREITQELAA